MKDWPELRRLRDELNDAWEASDNAWKPYKSGGTMSRAELDLAEAAGKALDAAFEAHQAMHEHFFPRHPWYEDCVVIDGGKA
jgi:hypothetical protein